MQGSRASSRREGKVSWVFSSCGTNLGYILELLVKFFFFFLKSGAGRFPTHCLSMQRDFSISVNGRDTAALWTG